MHALPGSGLCLGLQCAVIEYARNVVGLANAHSSEFDPVSPHPVIDLMESQKDVEDKGGTMRLGLYPARLSEGSLARRLYGDEVVYRAAGDHFLLVEYGPRELRIRLRFRAHALMQWLEANPFEGMYELTPGIRSLQIHYDSQRISARELMDYLQAAEAELARRLGDIRVPSRIVHLPLSWDDPSTRQAIEKYMQSVRPDAPWCPSNIEFIRRINGLESIDEVREILFNASYLVMGLGDVYIGAPVATPMDPRRAGCAPGRSRSGKSNLPHRRGCCGR